MKLRMKRKLTRPTIKLGSGHITPADSNIFLELGFPPEEAADLLEQAQKMIQEIRARDAKKADRKKRRPTAKKINKMNGAKNDL